VTALVELRKITKGFSGVKALDQVELKIYAGEVLALVGENGAGKSTLMKVLSGVYPQSSFSGEILLAGRNRKFYSPSDAEQEGIAIIHQELSNFDHLSVAENLFVGRWPKNAFGLVDWNRVYAESEIWLARVGLKIDPRANMKDLSVGAQQLVEIAKALAREGSVIILDEPTSALTDKEVDRLFSLVRELRKENKAIVYISHKMDEIYSLSDRITVLRDGKTVHTETTKTLDRDRLISLMVGREIHQLYPPVPERSLGEPVLAVRELQGRQDGKHRFGPLTFSIRAGEILGFAGLLGSGRSELLRAIAGDPAIEVSGSIEVNGKVASFSLPRDSIQNSVSSQYLPPNLSRF
jgi:D-xylose transport system ATP-binding protein